jgi:hypothetical protein
MSGGDLDGDQFVVSWNPEIIPAKADPPCPRLAEPKAPQQRPPVPKDPIYEMEEHLALRLGDFEIGKTSNEWDKATDRAVAGARDPYCKALWARYESCLDVNKSGCSIPEMPDLALKGDVIPANAKGPNATLMALIPTTLEHWDCGDAAPRPKDHKAGPTPSHKPDPDLTFGEGTKDWENDTEICKQICKEFWHAKINAEKRGASEQRRQRQYSRLLRWRHRTSRRPTPVGTDRRP